MKEPSKPLLQQLYDGELNLHERIHFESAALRSKLQQLSNEEDFLRTNLETPALQHFESLQRLHDDTADAYYFSYFALGFRLGARLMLEVLDA